MKTSKLKRFGSLVLCAALMGGIFAVPQKAEASTSQVTHVDFEDMTSVDEQFSLGADNTAASEYWKTYATVDAVNEGGKALHLKGGATKSFTLYLSQGWNANTRPTEVQYKFKIVNDLTETTNKTAYYFRPIYHEKTEAVCYPLRVYAQTRVSGTQCESNTDGAANKQKCQVTSDVTTSKRWTIATTEATTEWLQTTCSYDWSKYNADNNYELSVHMLITNISTGETVTDYTMTTSSGTSVNLMKSIATKTLYVGFSAEVVSGLDTWIDDIYVWSENFTTGATYGPLAQPEALGASPATSTTDGSVKVRMGFDYADVEGLAEVTDETPIQYGAVLVAGSPTYNTLTANAALLLDDDETNDATATAAGYTCTKKTLASGATLPHEYYVTISNSSENIGKRATSVGYVITQKVDGTKTIYYTERHINHSVMSLLKAVFNVTYLTDTNNVADNAIVSGSALETALNAYNGAEGTATLDTIKAATAGGSTTAEQRELLKSLHFALHSEYDK